MKTNEAFFRPPQLATTSARFNFIADYSKSKDRIPKPNRSGQPAYAPRPVPATERWTMGARCSTIRLQVCHAMLLLTLALSLHAQTNYTIDWYTIDGGGGTSTGGVYSVSGTIGQPDASQQTMTGGNYSLTGGFWALYAVQTPGAPTLTIVPAGSDQATISWAPASTNWVLQETLSLSPPSWTNSPSGNANPIVVPATLPTRFYRLSKP